MRGGRPAATIVAPATWKFRRILQCNGSGGDASASSVNTGKHAAAHMLSFLLRLRAVR